MQPDPDSFWDLAALSVMIMKAAGMLIAIAAFSFVLFSGRVSLRRIREKDYWWMRWWQ